MKSSPFSKKKPSLIVTLKKHPLLLCCCLIFLFLIVPLPWLATLPPGRDALMNSIGGRFAGNMTAGSCSLGWFSGLRCARVRYRGHGGAVTLESPEITNDRGLLALLTAPGSLGEIHVSSPTVTIQAEALAPLLTHSAPKPDAEAGPEAESEAEPEAGPEGPQAKSPGTVAATHKAVTRRIHWWNSSSFQLKADSGLVQLELDNGRIYPLFGKGEAEATLENGSLRYSLQASAGPGGEYNLHGEGFVNAPPADSQAVALLSTNTLVLDEIPASALPPLPWAPDFFMTSDGTATGHCRLTRGADGSLRSEGALVLRDLRLPPLAEHEDRLVLNQSRLLFDMTNRGDQTWDIKQLQLESPLLNLEIKGSTLGEMVDLNASARLDLALAGEGLRLKLGLHPDAKIERGGLQCVLQAKGENVLLPVRFDCLISDIAAVRGDEAIAWQQPLKWSSDWLFTQGLWPRLLQTDAKGAFCEVKLERNGESPHIFDLKAAGDLSGLFGEAGRVMQLPYTAGGRLDLAASSRAHGAGYAEELHLHIRDFTLEDGRDQTRLLPEAPLTIKGSFSRAQEEGPRSGAVQAEFWPGKLGLKLQNLNGEGDRQSGAYNLTGQVQVQRAQPLVRRLVPSLDALNLDGLLNLDMAAAIKGTQHQIQRFEMRIDQATVRSEDRQAVLNAANLTLAAAGAAGKYAPKEADKPKKSDDKKKTPQQQADQAGAASRLALSPTLQLDDKLDVKKKKPAPGPALLDRKNRTLTLAPLVLLSDKMRLEGHLHLGGWGLAPDRHSHALALHGRLDAGLLDAFLRVCGRMPNGVRLKGPSQLALHLEAGPKTLPEAEFAATLDWTGFGEEEKTLFQQRGLNLYARFEGVRSTESASWDLPEFSLQGPQFWAQGKGFLLNEGRKTPGILALQGQYRMAGEARPFQISVPFQ